MKVTSRMQKLVLKQTKIYLLQKQRKTNMTDRFIGPVRPSFNIEEELPEGKKAERLVAGMKSSGMIIDVTKKGLELNAYYTAFNQDTKYSNLREPVIITWEELDKIKGRVFNTKKKVAIKDRVESNIDIEYLKTLPIVTINGKKYYIDPIARERRSVEKPGEIWRF